MAVRVKKMSQTVVWIIMGLLIVGLAGFGATNLSGTARTIGSVGDEPITINAYGRELQREIRAVEAQTGQALQMDQVRALGLDRMVLDRLVTLAALDNERPAFQTIARLPVVAATALTRCLLVVQDSSESGLA